MPIITLPDGNNIDFPNKVTGLEAVSYTHLTLPTT